MLGIKLILFGTNLLLFALFLGTGTDVTGWLPAYLGVFISFLGLIVGTRVIPPEWEIASS